jgi:hypothetical protein
MLPQFAEDILDDFFGSAAIGEQAEGQGKQALTIETVQRGQSFGIAQAKALEEFVFVRILGQRRLASMRTEVHLHLRKSQGGVTKGL